jgi:hypothetical protein
MPACRLPVAHLALEALEWHPRLGKKGRGTVISAALPGAAVAGEAAVGNSLSLEYLASNCGSSYRGLHEAVVNHAGNKPEIITCVHASAMKSPPLVDWFAGSFTGGMVSAAICRGPGTAAFNVACGAAGIALAGTGGLTAAAAPTRPAPLRKFRRLACGTWRRLGTAFSPLEGIKTEGIRRIRDSVGFSRSNGNASMEPWPRAAMRAERDR